jgi:hypothetical protein
MWVRKQVASALHNMNSLLTSLLTTLLTICLLLISLHHDGTHSKSATIRDCASINYTIAALEHTQCLQGVMKSECNFAQRLDTCDWTSH